MAVMAGGIWFASRASSAAARIASLAVLPLRNLTDDSTLIEELSEPSAKRYIPASFTAIVYGALGDHDQAFEWPQRALEEQDSYLV
jgi:hypothetical protein